jgi:hypothetical protein
MQPRGNPKFFDVARPNQINPSSTSRPVIVGHRPMMVDPMVRGGVTPSSPPLVDPLPAPPPAPPAHVAKVITVSDEVKKDLGLEVANATSASSTLAPAFASGLGEVKSPEEPPAMTPEPTPAQQLPPEKNPKFSTNLAAPPEAVAPLPRVEPDLSHLPHIPVSHMPATSSGRVKSFLLWSFVLMFLLAFGGYLAIDAGLVSSSIDLPFHIFNSQS